MEKIKGKTSTGFNFEIDPERLDNMEFIDVLVELEDTTDVGKALTANKKLIDFVLDPEQKKKLYDHVRTKKGNVPIEACTKEVMEIIRYNGSDQEGSEEVKNV